MNQPVLLSDRYLLEERLGTGGMALVYRAKDQRLERYVAIKILRETYTNDPDFQELFRQEARAAANLSHPNLVTVHDFGLDDDRLFIVMEYVPGTHLKNTMQRRGRLPLEETLGLMVQACAGIGYAHRAGLVHCDIKPHNLLISPDHRLKVTDFGIARALASIHPDEKTDVVWGSPQYFSPEQAAGYAPSPASDVYSLGVILFEALTGQLPFQAESASELARLHREALPPSPASDVYSLGVILFEALTGQLPFQAESASELARLHREALPPSPRSINPAIPEALEQIMLKVLAKEPAARYRTADQLGRVLLTFSRQVGLQEGLAPTSATTGTTPLQPKASPGTPAATPSSPPGNLSSGSHPNSAAPVARSPATQENNRSPVNRNGASRPTPIQAVPEKSPWDIDWLTIGLGLLTLIAVGGLVPLYIWVYFLYFD